MSAGISRRTFFGLAAGAAAVHALPASVVGLAVEPAGAIIPSCFEWQPPMADLPPAHVPKVGDMIFLQKDGLYILPSTGHVFKLSSEWVIELGQQMVITHLPGQYLGIDRTHKPCPTHF